MAARQFGIALQDALGGMDPAFTQQIVQPAMPPQPQADRPMGKGQLIAGILADMLAGAAGRPAQFAPMLAQRREAEDARAEWGLRRQAELQDWQQKQDYARTHPEPSAMERNLATWQQWTPEQRQAYQGMQEANGNDFVTTTLPNGQFYAGPKSGIVAALTGGAAVPQRPAIGTRIPLNGGPTPPASDGFQR